MVDYQRDGWAHWKAIPNPIMRLNLHEITTVNRLKARHRDSHEH